VALRVFGGEVGVHTGTKPLSLFHKEYQRKKEKQNLQSSKKRPTKSKPDQTGNQVYRIKKKTQP